MRLAPLFYLGADSERKSEFLRHGSSPRSLQTGIGTALLLCAGLVCAGSLGAQVDAPYFRRLTTEDGLSQQTGMAIAQDSSGFIWIGTQSGLNRFDGERVRRYLADPSDSPSLSSSTILSLLVSDDGSLWIGTNNRGLIRHVEDEGRFVRVPVAPAGPNESSPSAVRAVSDMAESGGTLWLATDRGAVRLHPEAEMAHLVGIGGESAGVAVDSVTACQSVAAMDGRVFFGCGDDRVDVYDLSGPTEGATLIRRTRLGSRPFAIEPLSRDSAYVGTPSGLLLLDVGSNRVTEVALPTEPDSVGVSSFVNDVLRDRTGRLWVATRQGVVEMGPDEAPRRHHAHPADQSSLVGSNVFSLMEDRTGNLWFGTFDGVSVLSAYHRAILRIRSGSGPRAELTPGGVTAITSDARGRTWVGSGRGDVQWFDPAVGVLRSVRPDGTPPGAPGGPVTSLSVGPSGNLWIGILHVGIIRMDPETNATVRYADPSDPSGPLSGVVALKADPGGRVWAGTANHGLLLKEPGESAFRPFRPSAESDPLRESYVWPLIDDGRGGMWLGTTRPRGGVHRLTPEGRIQSWMAPLPETNSAGDGQTSAIPNGRILTMTRDGEGGLWIGTMGGGLFHFDPTSGEVGEHYRMEHGLPHDAVEGLVVDEEGFVWAGTDDGLARLEPGTGRVSRFGVSTGLQASIFFANSAHKTSGGALFLGGPGGLNLILPRWLPPAPGPPPVELIGFAISGEDRSLDSLVTADGVLELGPTENFFTFEFAALDFRAPEENRFRYRLEGLDPEWVDAGTSPTANYTSVPPGEYTFRVAATGGDGVWNEEDVRVPLRVLPPFYDTWWFRLTLFLLTASLALGAYAYRQRNLARVAAMRLRIAEDLHDDIGAHLGSIGLKSELERRKLAAESPAASVTADERALREQDRRERMDRLGEIERLARETARKVREMIWVVKAEHDAVSGLLMHLEKSADSLLTGLVEYEFRIPDDLPDRSLSMEQRRDVYLTFKEALQNILKHANASKVCIDASYSAPDLVLRIEDDGVGFDPGAVERGNGLDLMEDRAARHRSQVNISSRPGRGTTVELRIRVG